MKTEKSNNEELIAELISQIPGLRVGFPKKEEMEERRRRLEVEEIRRMERWKLEDQEKTANLRKTALASIKNNRQQG